MSESAQAGLPAEHLADWPPMRARRSLAGTFPSYWHSHSTRPMSPSLSDSIYYIGGGVIVGAGLLLGMWALLWDRPRGRLRCPMCWYDMSAQAGTERPACPECGRRVRRTRALQKTRRRWPAALLAASLLIGGAALTSAPALRNAGWVRWAPTTLLIACISTIGSAQDPVYVELCSRLAEHRDMRPEDLRWSGPPEPGSIGLWGWQRRFLASRCEAALATKPTTADEMLTLLRQIGPDAACAVDEMIAIAQRDQSKIWSIALIIEAIGPPANEAVPFLRESLVAGSDGAWSVAIIRALGSIGPDARTAVPELIEIIERGPRAGRYGSSDRFRSALSAVGRIGPDADAAATVLLAVIEDEDTEGRAEAMASLGCIAPSSAECRAGCVVALCDPEIELRENAAAFVIDDPARQDVVDDMTALLGADDVERRIAGARALMALGAAAADAVPDLELRLHDASPVVRLFAVRALAAIDERDLDRIRPALRDSDPVVRRLANELMTQRTPDTGTEP